LKAEDKIDELVDKVVLDARNGADNATKKIISNISKYLETFELSDGSFVNSPANKQLLTQLQTEIANAINSSTYPKAVTNVVRSLTEIETLAEQVLIEYNPSVTVDFDRLGVSQLRQMQTETIVQNMTGNGLTTEIRQPIRDAINRNVFAGAKMTETKAYLRDFLTASKSDKMNRMTRYANVWAQDGVMQYDGMIYDQFKREYGANYIRYVGSLIGDSRPQCVRWINKYQGKIPMDKLKSEIAWATTNGSGLNLAITPESFCTYRGGYNCRHKGIPIFLEDDE
jgi:hypothetical protein